MNSSIKNSPNLLGRIERASVLCDVGGTQVLSIEGWLFDESEPLAALQMGIPGSQMILVARNSGASLEHAPIEGHEDKLPGFKAEIPIPIDCHTSLVHFLATMADGITIAGGLPLPENIVRSARVKIEARASYSAHLQAWCNIQDSKYREFITSQQELKFQEQQVPDVSVVIPVFNRAELLLDCLNSLQAQTNVKLEIILVDNNSDKATQVLYEKLKGINIIKNKENQHFIQACNQGAQIAKGELLLFLNSDTWVYPQAIANAVNCIKSDSAIAAVGARLLGVDGLCQEAGSYILSDGSTSGYGRRQPIEASEVMFQRSVDYCSAAFLLTHTQHFLLTGKFDTFYYPAYFEDVDYCTKLWELGYKVVYEPTVCVIHAENASAAGDFSKTYQLVNREKFARRYRHRLELNKNYTPDSLYFRHALANRGRKNILVIDDQIPLLEKGSGFPRLQKILKALVELEYNVTFYPMLPTAESWNEIYAVIPKEVEVVKDLGRDNLAGFLNDRKNFYDNLLVSRPQNMEAINDIALYKNVTVNLPPVIYDSEAIGALREIGKLQWQKGIEISKAEYEFILHKELDIYKKADKVLCVSAKEAKIVKEYLGLSVDLLAYPVEIKNSTYNLTTRKNICTIGPMINSDTPNTTGFKWFINEVWPSLLNNNKQLKFQHAGAVSENLSSEISEQNIEFMGPLADLSKIFNFARVFVAPQQYSAGIPLKCLDALSYGVPCVVTSHIADQLGWTHEKEALVANTKEQFAMQIERLLKDDELWHSLVQEGREYLVQNHNTEDFMLVLKNAIEGQERKQQLESVQVL